MMVIYQILQFALYTLVGCVVQSDRELAKLLFPQRRDGKSAFKMPDYGRVHRELAKPGVTL